MHKIKQTAGEHKKKYGLFTAITMVVGIVIGSGIFFKSDNILIYTNGNILLGVLVFIIAAVGIIFGSLTISKLSSRTGSAGGVIAYAQEFVGEKTACAVGWFQTFIYYPVLVAVISWVVGVYCCILFGLPEKLELQILIGTGYMIFSFLINTFSAKLGGYFQNISTIIKLIPLIFIATGGLLLGDTGNFLSPSTQLQPTGSAMWLSALAPIAFSFDGWIVAASISHEIKNSKQNLPLAYTIAPIFILLIYVFYFVGISIYIGPQEIIALGDSHVNVAATKLLGDFGAKIVLIFIVISVMGTVNGLILGSIRMPYSLSIRGMFVSSVKKHSNALNIPLKSAITSFAASLIWMLFHYISQRYKFFGHSDISEGFVVISYAIYTILYIKVILLYKKGDISSFFQGVISPVLAILGSFIILYAGLQSHSFYFYIIVSILVISAALRFLYLQEKR